MRLVFLAGCICFLSALTAFVLAQQIRTMPVSRRFRWLCLLSFITGAGIWSTHFIAMLAYEPHLPTRYTPGLTIFSMVIAVLAAGLGWSVLLSGRRGAVASGLAFAVGISAMHFTGMAALRTTGHLDYAYDLLAGAMLAGVLATIATAHIFIRRNGAAPILPGLMFTVAICIIHFGSMASITIMPDPSVPIPMQSIDAPVLTLAIVALTIVMMGVALATTILEARIARLAVEEAERLKHFTQSAMEGLAILDGDHVVDANETFWSIAGYDPVRPPAGLSISTVLPAHREHGAHPAGLAFTEQQLRDAGGNIVQVETAVRVGSVGGVPREMVIIRDITQRKAAAERIAHLASHDPLTGAANRLSMAHALTEAETHAAEERPISLLCLDLDRFKAINDLYGHPMGDAVLIEVARRIRACLGDDEILARLGGDEFAVLQPAGEQPLRAVALAERMLEAIAAPMDFEGVPLSVGTSIGIALYPSNATSMEDLHKKADLALYRAKADGRGIVRFFDSAMDRQLAERHRMEVELRDAIGKKQFHLHYQPLARLETGGIIGFEVLLRWTHPEMGAVKPSDFVPLAEDTGLIVGMGEWVLRAACREAACWTQPLKVAVNISPAQFASGGIVGIVSGILDETGLDPRRLDLEITESVLAKNPDDALIKLRQLRALGVGIAMDDFGTGQSALSSFRIFPLDTVKIDQAFVRDLANSREAAAIVKSIIGLGKGLGLSIIAEGVETMDQMELLLAEGCEQIQGYLLSPPRPIEHFENVLVDRAGAASRPIEDFRHPKRAER